MKIIILIEKYGNNCNRLFQSLHFHAKSINEGSIFLNLSLLGILKYDNVIFRVFDLINNSFLKVTSEILKLFLKNKNNSIQFFGKINIKIVSGWYFRDYHLTTKYYKELSRIYNFKNNFKDKSIKISKKFFQLKDNGKFLIGIHIRRGDYITWENGDYYFDDKIYDNLIKKLRKYMSNKKKDPFFVGVSDQSISENIQLDIKTKGSWIEDQLCLQNCDLIVGPPSTFTMWASYISKIPLIQVQSNGDIDFKKKFICQG